MQKNTGFTLVELMVTIAVLAIIMMMAVPSFSTLMAKQNLNATTQELIATLTEARGQAILKRTAVTVTLNSTSENSSNHYYWSPKSNNTLTAPSGLSSITFNENGTVTADTDFVICNSRSNTTKTFSLSVMGVVYAMPSADGTC
ncbi:prepilin-type N-terminal cleavage/methylation domain-containing protein [Acinetobacter qingfengensis]|uniref:Pili assembly chaperone n=1 Tax=Acinetobacter qingfengensis TaxID=1262585 RepID=A0A1E7QXM0_9GAMM|nr:prepilin-type N-terminal cleavage/methylation domain-containing protein [Acinetobacter qingfengensis]KAA8731694.1 prepilin-type N-terminal cleavage/methylation domain-containing protein [Acinetobacter qingfengensis]OEY91793.1 pili assembly chaperone [Acinetobacter qingfengensis]